MKNNIKYTYVPIGVLLIAGLASCSKDNTVPNTTDQKNDDLSYCSNSRNELDFC